MGKKSDRPNLPVLGGLWGTLESGETPTLDDAREKLGGPWIGRQDLGAPVDIPGPDGRRIGVVIHATPTERDVWIGGGRIQRVALADTRPAGGLVPDLDDIVDDAHVHASLRTGQRITFQRRDGSVGEGTLVEKCRYGSLVGLEDGRVLAVSFRKLAPAAEDGAPS
ncbi:MAG: hypothetical protein RID81_43210 [Sandaracinaceae bacterium]|nr:hypothetical protein [Myxococcales bacterium]